MMSTEDYRDRILVCRDCGNEFTFTAGEQEFYASKNLMNTPGRCPTCRASRRGSQQPSNAPHAPRGVQYDATCATCGRATTVPFVPSEGRLVYCNDCFQAQRASRPPRQDYSSNYGGGGGNYGGGGRGGRRDRDRDRDRDRW